MLILAAQTGYAQKAFIYDAWWTFQQDCNGDGCKAGTLPGDLARLNWEPDVTNCSGTLTVYEKIYTRPCGSGTWTPIYTNAPHVIVGCRTTGQQHLDVQMSPECACWDYLIEIYRNGQANPDHSRSSTNDVDLAQHREQLLASDFCLSDFFDTCISLNGPSGSESDVNSDATLQPGEPAHAGNPGGHSLWYCWSSTTNTPVTFDTIGSTFDTVLAVYTGNSVSNLTVVGSNDDISGATNRQSRVMFTPVPGTTYHIAVDGFGGAAGIVALNWNQSTQALPNLILWGPAAAPTVISRNFSSSDCEVIEGCETTGTHRLLSFSTETRNIGSGDLIMGNPSTNKLFIWATCHGHYHFEQFAEYNLLDTNMNVVASGHKVGFCLSDVKSFGMPGASANARYNCSNQGIQRGWADVYEAGLPCQYIDVTSIPPGNYVLQMIVNPDNVLLESRTDDNITLVEVFIPPANCSGGAPSNDSFDSPVVVESTPWTYNEFNICATKQSGEPNHSGNVGGHSVWFSWTPAVDQTVTMSTRNSDFDTLLAVYTGEAVNALTVVATNDDILTGVTKQSRVTFNATAGTTYHIAVDGYANASGTAVLSVGPPANDDFTNGVAVSGTAGGISGWTVGASKQLGEPAHASDVGGHSVWYQWTAPTTGPVDFNTAGSSFDTTLAVYTGNVLSNLVSIASNDDDVEQGGLFSSRLWFNAISNTTYRIAIDGFGGDAGSFTLNWNMESRLSIAQLPDGNVKLSLTGVDWQRYVLLGSSNSVLWTTNTAAITMAAGVHDYTNWPGTNVEGLQFFKAMRTP